MTPSPSPSVPDLSQSYTHRGFQPVQWFYATFGVLPHREIYQLASTGPTSLAEIYNREPSTFTELEASGKRIRFSR